MISDGRKRLLVLLDHAPGDVETMAVGRRVARDMRARITLLYVIRLPEEVLPIVPMSALSSEVDGAQTYARELVGTAPFDHADDVPQLRIAVSSSPLRALAEIARGGFDLIVVSASGDGLAGRIDCPVLRVPIRL